MESFLKNKKIGKVSGLSQPDSQAVKAYSGPKVKFREKTIKELSQNDQKFLI